MINLGEFRGDMRTFAKHHAIDRHVLCHVPPFFKNFLLCFHFYALCLETHVGMRACLQCMRHHGQFFFGGSRM